MSHARTQHPNARLTPRHRRNMVACLVDRGWSVTATAERFQVVAKTVRKWRDRFVADGDAGLEDRSSRPHRSPNRTSRGERAEVIVMRTTGRWGADHIAHEVGLAASTVQNILCAQGLGRLDRGDRATDREPVRRYQRDRPGELVHVDIKKLAGIPDGGGWRIHGRGQTLGATHANVGYRFLHSAIDDRTRVVYSEILSDEQGASAAAFWHRANTFFAQHGIGVERVLTDNGPCYRSRLWRTVLDQAGITHKRTRPYRPQTNGKIERFHRILLEEWAYIRDWTSDNQRRAAYDGFIHFYNHHRSHGSLNWATPIATLTQLLQDNLPEEHN